MNCDWVKENLTLYVYDELGDDSRYELEQHVGRCTDCSAELRSLREFHQSMSAAPRPEPAPNLLAASRIRLSGALEGVEQRRAWWILDPWGRLRAAKFSPALTAVLLMIGFAGGAGTVWQVAVNSNPAYSGAAVPAALTPAEASIAGIRAISQKPGTNQVQITYDTMSPQEVEGSLNDQRIQQLLLYAARNNTSSGVRLDSVNLLTKTTDDARIREALKTALLDDSNPGVRLKALEALGPYVKQDVSVRNVVLQALQDDSNPGIRAESIRLLQSVRVDSSVRQVLQKLSQKDENQFIRRQSRRMLATLPEID